MCSTPTHCGHTDQPRRNRSPASTSSSNSIDQIEAFARVRRAQNGVLIGGTERADAGQDEAVRGWIAGEFPLGNHRPVTHLHCETGAAPRPRSGRARGARVGRSSSPSGQSSTSARGYGSSGSHSTTRTRRVPTVTSANRLPSSATTCSISATTPTSDRVSPPPTSLPRSIRTTPNSCGGSVETVADQLLVSRLEDVKRQDHAGQQHRAQREHRHHGHG